MSSRIRLLTFVLGAAVAIPGPLAVLSGAPLVQGPGTADGLWSYIGGDAWHTRCSPADQINAGNFSDLDVAWVRNGASFDAASGRSTPVYVDGKLITVAGARRHVVAI